MEQAQIFGLCGAALIGIGLYGFIANSHLLRRLVAFNVIASPQASRLYLSPLAGEMARRVRGGCATRNAVRLAKQILGPSPRSGDRCGQPPLSSSPPRGGRGRGGLYERRCGAPAPASAMLSGLVPKASFYIIVRIWFDVMPQEAGAIMPVMLGVLGSCAIVYGSVLAIRQERLKLVVAYSTVAQLGYLFLVFPLAGHGGDPQPWAAGAWTGGMFHAFSHALAKAAMFLCAGLFMEAVGHDRIAGLKGIARHLPMTAFAFALAAITLMGLPPSGGFTAKYLLLTASFAGSQFGWAVVMMIGGLLAAVYLFRPLTYTFAKAGMEAKDLVVLPRARQVLPLVLAGLSIILGIASAGPYDFLQIGRPEAAEEGLD
jgi:multicomponent Na+:H+ antiporter subunit D